jgi:hypothetical protein
MRSATSLRTAVVDRLHRKRRNAEDRVAVRSDREDGHEVVTVSEVDRVDVDPHFQPTSRASVAPAFAEQRAGVGEIGALQQPTRRFPATGRSEHLAGLPYSSPISGRSLAVTSMTINSPTAGIRTGVWLSSSD